MRSILIYTELTVREARRHRIVWTALGLGLAFVILYGVGLYFIHRDMMRSLYERAGNIALKASLNFMVLSALYVVSFMGVMLAVLSSVGAIAGEIASHTIQALAAKPLPRASIVLGKWLGLLLILLIYIVLLSAAIIAVTFAISGYLLENALPGVFLITLQAIIMLSICIAGGTRLSTITNGVVAFMLYGLAFVGGWIEQIGQALNNDTAVDIGILSSLLVPSEAMWKMAAYLMQPPALRALGLSPFSMSIAPSAATLVYALLYVAAMVGLAVYSFERRDL